MDSTTTWWIYWCSLIKLSTDCFWEKRDQQSRAVRYRTDPAFCIRIQDSQMVILGSIFQIQCSKKIKQVRKLNKNGAKMEPGWANLAKGTEQIDKETKKCKNNPKDQCVYWHWEVFGAFGLHFGSPGAHFLSFGEHFLITSEKNTIFQNTYEFNMFFNTFRPWRGNNNRLGGTPRSINNSTENRTQEIKTKTAPEITTGRSATSREFFVDSHLGPLRRHFAPVSFY